MGLKSDIKAALLKNVKPAEPKDWKPTDEGEVKLDTLSEDLANAILDFLTDKDRCVLKVDKLLASTNVASTLIGETLIAPTHTVGPPGPHTIPPIKIPPIDVGLITVEVDKDGQGSGNPVNGGKPQSNYSEVRLRKDQVEEM